MTTREQLESELRSRLQVSENASLFPSTRITELIQNAYKWATTLVIWLDLVRARTTSTKSGHEYYDYPDNFRTGSIVMLTVGGEPYERYRFNDFKKYKINHSSTQKKMFANFGRQYFINPIPTSNGSNDMQVWGAIEADDLDSASSETIFSGNKETANEAVVKKAYSVAIAPAKKAESQAEEAEATATLMKISEDEWSDTALDQGLESPNWNIPDFFAPRNSSSSIPGNFNNRG